MGKIKMNEKLEKQFKKRLNDIVHIEFKTVQKIKELRNKTFDFEKFKIKKNLKSSVDNFHKGS